MLEVGVFWKATAGVVSAAFAVAILAGNSSRPANRFLAFFLLLIAGNQTAETFRALATEPAARLVWFRIASVFAFLDPFFLYCFASVFPENNRLHRPRWLATAAAPLLLIIPGVFVLQLDPTATTASYVVHRTWAAYTAIVYVIVFGHFLDRFAVDEDGADRWMVAALAVAALPVVERLAGLTINDLSLAASVPRPGGLISGRLVLVPALTAAVLANRVWERLSDPGRRWLLGWMIGGTGLVVFAKLNQFYGGLAAVSPLTGILPGAGLFGGTAAAWRWLVFGSVVSAAVAQDAILEMPLEARERAAYALAGGWLIASAGAIGMLVAALADPLSPALLAGLGIAALTFLAAGGFQAAVAWTARNVYGLPDPDRPKERWALFRRGVDEVLARGDEPDRVPELTRLRRELGLDAQSACLVRRMATAPEGPLRPGDLLAGRYRIRESVGTGGFARALVAQDEVIDRTVVLKEVFHDPDAEVGRREAELAAAINHPNVLTVHDVVERPGCTVLVTEHVAAGTLADRLDEGPIPEDEAMAILDGLLAGVAAIHEQGIVHRDLKPANVLLVDETTPVIADFGVAHRRGEGTDEATTDVKGTLAWMPPEQRRGGPTAPRSDLYAVGAIGRALLGDDLDPVRDAILERATAEDPTRRWPSAEAMRSALARADVCKRGGPVQARGDRARPA